MNTEYYNKKSNEFFKDTINLDMSSQYKIFEDYLSIGDMILDLGCGSGRDTKHFLNLKYNVIATDISMELIKKSSEYIGQEVLFLDMRSMNFENKFNGIWACASILHIKKNEINEVLKKCYKALKKNGVLYASFKYGDIDYEKDGRYFSCFTEKSFKNLLFIKGFLIEKIWITTDVREERKKTDRWLNIILKKS